MCVEITQHLNLHIIKFPLPRPCPPTGPTDGPKPTAAAVALMVALTVWAARAPRTAQGPNAAALTFGYLRVGPKTTFEVPEAFGTRSPG